MTTETKVTVRLTRREIATIRAALHHWAGSALPEARALSLRGMAADYGPALDRLDAVALAADLGLTAQADRR